MCLSECLLMEEKNGRMNANEWMEWAHSRRGAGCRSLPAPSSHFRSLRLPSRALCSSVLDKFMANLDSSDYDLSLCKAERHWIPRGEAQPLAYLMWAQGDMGSDRGHRPGTKAKTISPNHWGLAKGLYSSSQSTRPQVQGHWCSRDIIHQELAVCHRPGQWSDDGPCGVYEKTEISEWFIAGAGLCSRSGSGTPVYAPQSLKHALVISSTGNVSPPWGQRCDGLWRLLIGDLFLPPVDGLRTKYDLKLHQTMPWASWNQQSWPTLWASRTQMLKEEEAGEGLSNSLRVKGKLYDFKGVLKSTCTGVFIRNQNNLLSKKLI